MNYGMPYIGSKNRIAQDIVNVMPSGERLVDLFCGGCAITHCAMLSGKWKRFLANDLNEQMPQLFLDAIEGKYKDEMRWISREDFFRLKDKDAFVRTVWSFGNKGETYIFGKPIEPYKRACHYAVVLDQWDEFATLCPEVLEAARNALNGMPISTWIERRERRKKFGPAIIAEMKRIGNYELTQSNPLYRSMKWKKKPELKNNWCFVQDNLNRSDRLNELYGLDNLWTLQSLQNMERMERLQSLASLETLQNLERLERLQNMERIEWLQNMENTQRVEMLDISSTSYDEVRIEEGDIVYADPPYKNTGANYGLEFDHNKFWDWVATRNFPVYVSEYSAPEGFVEIFSKEKLKLGKGGNSAKNGKALEKVYVHKKWR